MSPEPYPSFVVVRLIVVVVRLIAVVVHLIIVVEDSSGS
jgi:hypothetical protein